MKQSARKSFLYRWLNIGAVPTSVRPALEREGILLQDEGVAGRFHTPKLKAPGKRFVQRSEGFLGSLVLTHSRFVLHTFGKRQINLPLDDPGVRKLRVRLEEPDRLSISFESADVQPGWSGVMEFRLRTRSAADFAEALWSRGALRGEEV
jgi:hypothetical protein